MSTFPNLRLTRVLSCFCCAILVVLIFSTAAVAQGQQEAKLLRVTFEAGDYQATMQLANDLIARQPGNALAHYYLGSSLAKFGRIDAARKSLAKCQDLSKGTDLARYAERALRDLMPYKIPQDKNNVEPSLSSAQASERSRLLAQQEEEIKAAEKRFDENVNRLPKSLSAEELRVATEKEFEKLNKEQQDITERYQRRADILLRRGQTSSFASSRNVQNYSVSGDPSQAVGIPSENPMQAQAQSLILNNGRASSVSSKSPNKKKPQSAR
jgi:tetratricopeptide (TPR) repeat protein